ncbi:MAG: response regulator [Aquaticitalea sp.]
MFQKILIAEDQHTIHKGLEATLKELQVNEVHTVQYCDDALLKIKSALHGNAPYDVLITDLSFKEDHRTNQITSGEALIEIARKVQPQLKIVVFSVEHRIGKIKHLIDGYHIDGYVEKGRDESRHIKKALRTIMAGSNYFSDGIEQLLKNAIDIKETDEYDQLILQLLAKGLKREQIAAYFDERELPNKSLRSIEKRLTNLKLIFNAQTSEQLIAIAIDRGLI